MRTDRITDGQSRAGVSLGEAEQNVRSHELELPTEKASAFSRYSSCSSCALVTSRFYKMAYNNVTSEQFWYILGASA